jgi:hypothetical protein
LSTVKIYALNRRNPPNVECRIHGRNDLDTLFIRNEAYRGYYLRRQIKNA